LRYCQ